MTQKQKELSKFWIPIVISILIPTATILYAFGRKDHRLESLEGDLQAVELRLQTLEHDTTDRLGRIETKVDMLLNKTP